MPKRTPEELADDNDRIRPIALFLSAESYWLGANVLYRSEKRRKRTIPFADKPIYFCYYHAIELYIKSLLRCHHGVDELETKFRHHTTKLKNRAGELGIAFNDEDEEVLKLMGETDAVIRSRYTKTGLFTWPRLEALNQTCKRLRKQIHAALKKEGVPVRPLMPKR